MKLWFLVTYSAVDAAACFHEFLRMHLGAKNDIIAFLFFLLQVFNTSLAEPHPDGYEDVANVVPPYSAYSAQGQPEVRVDATSSRKTIRQEWLNRFLKVLICLPLLQGDLVYVNYGRTEDFLQLEREIGINVTGKIVIVRYGKIFRGNKVWKDGPH